MYEWVPFLKGNYFTYSEYAAGIFYTLFALLGLLSLLIAWLIKTISKCFSSEASFPKQLYTYGGLHHPNPLLQTNDFTYNMEPIPYRGETRLQQLKEKFEKGGCVGLLVSYFTWSGWVLIACAPLGFSLFGVFLTPFITALFVFLQLLYRARHAYRKNLSEISETIPTSSKGFDKKVKSARSTFRKLAIIFLIFSFGASYSFQGGCISFYEGYVGLRIKAIDLSISTRLTRYFELDDACPPGPPCHLYATLPEDPSTGVFINVQTATDYTGVLIRYDTKAFYLQNGYLRYSEDSSPIVLSHMEQRGRRTIHSALVDGLIADTRYFFQVEYDNIVQASFDYLTFPDENGTRDILLSTGGDNGDQKVGRLISAQAGAVDPDVLIIGGDLAYDDGEQSCYFAWDNILNSYAMATLNAGRLVPLLFSIGNHDIGLNALSQRKVEIDHKGPFYLIYFPQHTVKDVDVVGNIVQRLPNLNERKSYHYHKMGKVVHLNLDSGYITYFGEQVRFINEVANAFPNHVKMANQHNPTYWGCESNHDEAVQETILQWVPLFDKYRFMSVFENHEHCFKKSFKLTGNAVNDNGTYYLGNGNWGARLSHACNVQNQTGILEAANSDNHFWFVNISSAGGVVAYTPIDQDGNFVVDTFEQDMGMYVDNINKNIARKSWKTSLFEAPMTDNTWQYRENDRSQLIGHDDNVLV